MSAPDSSVRELIALAGTVQCEQPAGAVNLVLRGQAGVAPGTTRDASAGLTEVLFSDATEVTPPAGLHDVRVFELLDASAPADVRQFRLLGPQLQLDWQARSVQLHRGAAKAFYGAVPPPRVPLRLRLGWSLLLAALRLPGAVAVIRKLRGST